MSIRERFVFDARIGAGGMAEVFRARRIGVNDFSRAVAIKRMLGGAAGSAQFREMFIAEARVTSQLVHPNIVSVIDFDRDDDGSLCLVMELVDGCDLSRLAATGLLPFSVVNYVVVEALKGLAHAHGFKRDRIKGVVHRDMSPHNLLLSWHGEIKISDFGLAKTWSADAVTATQALKGKPAYMSPEQANSEALDGRSDLFAVGVIMWELLTGRRLFGADDTRASLAAVLFGTVPRPSETRSDIPRDLERVTMKLLKRNRNDRYRRAEEAIIDLLACSTARADGPRMLATTMAERLSRPMPAKIAAPPHSFTGSRRVLSRPLLVAIGLGIPAVSVALSLAISRPKPGAQSPVIRPQVDHIALVELGTRGIDAGVPVDVAVQLPSPEIHFKYILDLDEVPRSCQQLFRFCQLVVDSKNTTLEEKRWAVNLAQLRHDVAAQFVSEGDDDAMLDDLCRGSYGSEELLHRAAPDIPSSDLASLATKQKDKGRPNVWGDYFGGLVQLRRRKTAFTTAELFGSAAQADVIRTRTPECFAELKLLDQRVLCASVAWQDRMTYENEIFKLRTRLNMKVELGAIRTECRVAHDKLLKTAAKGC